MESNKRLLLILGVLGYVIVNLPLLGIVLNHGFSEITLSIIGHAPNQFLFLAIFFPLVLISLIKAIGYLNKLADIEPAVKESPSWKYGVQKKLAIIVVPIIVSILVVYLDTSTTPSDFYQMDKAVAQQSAQLNKKIIALHFSDRLNVQDNTSARDDVLKLMANYRTDKAKSTFFTLTEAMELFVDVYTAVVATLLGYLFMRLSGYALKHKFSDDFRVTIKNGKVHIGVCLIAFSLWTPLRTYNIIEIQTVYDYFNLITGKELAYATSEPYVAYIVIILVACAILSDIIIRMDIEKLKLFGGVITFLFSGGLIVFIKKYPETASQWIGSGISPLNLFYILLITILTMMIFSNLVSQIKLHYKPDK